MKLRVLQHELASTSTELASTSTSSQSLTSRLGQMSKSLSKATPGWVHLAAAAAAFGPAVLPVLGAATAATIGLGAALAGAGSALGVFAAAAKGNLTELSKQMTKVQAANKSANLAEQTAAKDRTKAQKQAIVNARQMTAAFHKEFGQEAGAIEKLKAAWLSFVTKPVVSGTIAQGARLLTAVLPHLTPLLKLGAYWAQALMGALGSFTVSGGLDRLVAGLAKLGRVSLTGFLAVFHNLAVGIGALGPGLGQFSTAVVGGLVKLSAAFASWAQNKGAAALASFFESVKKSAPQVGQLLLSLVRIIPTLVKGLFPLAPVSLAISTALAGLIAKVPPKVITAIAVAFVAWSVAVRTLTGVTKVMTAVQAAFDVVMDANPIGLVVIAIAALVAGLVVAYKHFAWFRDLVQATWGWIKDHWPLLLSIITGPIGAAVIFIVRHFTLVKDFIRWAWDQIVIFSLRAVKSVLDAFSHIPLIGHIFGKAADAVGRELGRMQRDSAATWRKIQAGMDSLHGKHVTLTFGLDLPAGVSYPTRPIKGRAAGWRVPGYGGGDRWPALLEGGEAVIPKHLVPEVAPFLSANRVPGFAAGGIAGPRFAASLPTGLAGVFRGLQSVIGAVAAEVKRLVGVVQVFAGGGALGGDAAANKALARRMFPWGASQWPPFVSLEMAEAGFNRFARNPTSGAYGIPQALPPTKMPFAAQAAGGSHAGAQLDWMWRYIAERYGSPAAAWAHEVSAHWYDQGGWLPPGLSVALNTTGRPERVGGGGNTYVFNITLPPGSDREQGRRIVDFIKKYEAGSGPGWRR